MRLLRRRLLHALDAHGLRGLLRPALGRDPHPAPRPPAPHPFDLAHAVDTSGFLPGEDLHTGAAPDLYNTAYYAISPSTLQAALAAVPVDPARTTFVDLGCGKGRALLIAAQLGFRKVLGVEIAPTLATIARANTASFPAVEIRTGDAARVQYPPAPLLVFLYHPFLAPQLRRVLRNLLRQQPSADPTYLLFANPGYDRLLARFPELTPCWTRTFPLSPEDALADRHGITSERYALYRVEPR